MKFVIFIVLSILSSLNWGSTGHRVIAEVATNYLTDNARFKINKITIPIYIDIITDQNISGLVI